MTKKLKLEIFTEKTVKDVLESLLGFIEKTELTKLGSTSSFKFKQDGVELKLTIDHKLIHKIFMKTKI